VPRINPELVEQGPYGRTIRMTVLLGTNVHDRSGSEVGKIHDVFGRRKGPVLGGEPAYVVEHVVAGHGAFGDRLGYDRHDMTGPWPLAALFNRLKRGAVGFGWTDIDTIDRDRVTLTRTRGELRSVPDLSGPDHKGRGVGDGVYLALRLLDSQVLDKSGYMCGNVDDLELTLRAGRAAPYVSGILAGPGALAHRIGGRLGIWIESLHKRLHPGEGTPSRIDFKDVDRVWHQVELTIPRDELETDLFEQWVRDRLISKIPGSG
jgi:sporulation protein YlmC with PRC-barrel domain